jgi:hypothetical protein
MGRTVFFELLASEEAASDSLYLDDLPQPVLHLDELCQVLHHFLLRVSSCGRVDRARR